MRGIDRHRYTAVFVILTSLYFLPAVPSIAEYLRSLWLYSIAIYWTVLTLIAIALGFKAVEGVER